MTRRLDASAYRNAEQLLIHYRSGLVPGGRVRPQWIDGGARFWYTRHEGEEKEFVLVDPVAGTREVVTDPDFADRMAAEVGNFLELTSPDKRHAVFRRGHDLWLCSPAEDLEGPLTTDGEEHYEYAGVPDAMRPTTLLASLGIPDVPPAAVWSPDSTRVLTHRTDQRDVREVHWVEARPADGTEPALRTKRYAYPGDEHVVHAELIVLDVATGAIVRSKGEPLMAPLFSPIGFNLVWWAEDSTAVYYLEQPRDLRTLRLNRLDPETGDVTTVLSESGETRVEPNQYMGAAPMVRVLGDDVLWYSQRDGWGHLYLYDARTGMVRNRVTTGAWAVREILHVDQAARVVYFTASGLVDEDPYRRSICRVGLDGTGFARVVDDDLDHIVAVPETTKGYFIDTASTVASPPVVTVRDWDGRVLVELERPDTSRLEAVGWTPPRRFCAKAADGETDIYGVLHLPPDFDPEQRYPVIDSPYPGPQTNRVDPSFDPGIFGTFADGLAALGFVVVAVDGRGTPGRSKAFHDASYGNLASAGCLEDHVAALRQLAETRPWMDLDRGVGIFGMSGGGFATVRAMLDFPDVYTVGVAICGVHDNRYYHQAWGETYNGVHADHARGSNVQDADRLEGSLLLIHGGMDDNVPPEQTLRLADRLLAADKDFELCIIPGADHMFIGHDHHMARRLWDYLVRHHMGAEPPAGYRITPAPLDLDLLTGFFG